MISTLHKKKGNNINGGGKDDSSSSRIGDESRADSIDLSRGWRHQCRPWSVRVGPSVGQQQACESLQSPASRCQRYYTKDRGWVLPCRGSSRHWFHLQILLEKSLGVADARIWPASSLDDQAFRKIGVAHQLHSRFVERIDGLCTSALHRRLESLQFKIQNSNSIQTCRFESLNIALKAHQ